MRGGGWWCRASIGSGAGSRAGARDRRRDAESGSGRHHLGDVVSGELGELVAVAGLVGLQRAHDERAFLLEEEDVSRLLLVQPATKHAERRLVEAGDVDRRWLRPIAP